jgi:hypothetical protein
MRLTAYNAAFRSRQFSSTHDQLFTITILQQNCRRQIRLAVVEKHQRFHGTIFKTHIGCVKTAALAESFQTDLCFDRRN